jgi:cytochrome c556
MIDDPIVEEIRRFRAAHAAKYGNDLDRIFAAIKQREAKSKRTFVNLGPKLLSLKTGS